MDQTTVYQKGRTHGYGGSKVTEQNPLQTTAFCSGFLLPGCFSYPFLDPQLPIIVGFGVEHPFPNPKNHPEKPLTPIPVIKLCLLLCLKINLWPHERRLFFKNLIFLRLQISAIPSPQGPHIFVRRWASLALSYRSNPNCRHRIKQPWGDRRNHYHSLWVWFRG